MVALTPSPSLSPSVLPSPSPSPVEVIHNTITYVASSPHLFQLAQIVQYVGTGVGLSIIHSLLLNSRLPKWANRVLPVVYSVLAALADVVVKGTVNWSDWYQVFVQVLTGAVAWYAIVTLVNEKTPSPSLPVQTTV